ncbi:MAG: hypothetical protein JWO13_579 [Acidobacteriales bacterium]|nr:hypothetical protein [Terriglobales bacterium]
MPVLIKRAYDKPSKSDGIRVLVEKDWPRGLSKSGAKLDLWLPALGASEKLSRIKSGSANGLQRKYFADLDSAEAMAALEMLHSFATQPKPVSLLYSAKEPERTAAAMLRDLLQGGRKPPNGSGPGKASAGGGEVRAMRKGK